MLLNEGPLGSIWTNALTSSGHAFAQDQPNGIDWEIKIEGSVLSRRAVPAVFVNLSCSGRLLRICIVEAE
jgi:hypothetical protein